MADDDPENMSEDQRRALRDYWLQFYSRKKFTVPKELEQVSGKSLEEMGLSKRDFKIKDSSRGAQASDFRVERSNVRSQYVGLTNGSGLTNGKGIN
jgi:hypothetical protein